MEKIEVLSMNGLGGGLDCSNARTIPLFGTSLQNAEDVKIPSCLWSVNSLTTMHLTGNGYAGDITAVESGIHLYDVSLSHNRIDGTIPPFIRRMKKADVSHNRFVGHLSSVSMAASNETELRADVNRLSGRLPLEDLKNINILDILRGNLFSCETVPENDASSGGYICGNYNVETVH